MKMRESGMPEEAMWDNFFEPDTILDRMGINGLDGTIVDLGCGYGTFALPAAARTSGLVYAIDIEPEMVLLVGQRAANSGIQNLVAVHRDFILEGTGLPEASCEYVMMFNILHAEEPMTLLAEAKRILVSGGRAGIVHWIHDAATPRGPSMDIRPRPERCQEWMVRTGFALDGGTISLAPYHYGLVGKSP